MEYALTAAVAMMAGTNLGAVGVAAARWYHTRTCTREHPCDACRGVRDPHVADAAFFHDRPASISVARDDAASDDRDERTRTARPQLSLVR